MNEIGLSMSGAVPIIEHNNFFDDKIGIELNSRYVQQYYDHCNPVIENNNILSTNWQIDIRGNNDLFFQDNLSWAINEDYYCSENYWGQEKKIKDNDYWMDVDGFYFIIESELNNLVINSGINN
ncbi:hypothetical protein EOM09_05930 [bacterium]|nr:hypothetical protein [bacterium]